MSALRTEYFVDLIRDAKAACERESIEPEDEGMVIAALIVCDSFNGIRKAMLTPNFIVAQNARQNGSQQY